MEKQNEPVSALCSGDLFGWFYRIVEPDHVIALCGRHKYLAGKGWRPGAGALAPLPNPPGCCVCLGTATIKRMRCSG